MSKLQLILLGHFDCLLPSGERISLSMRKAEVLLAYLALAPGIRHPRERLLNLLWSDRGEEQARNSLRQCLSAIKKSLGDVADLVIQVDRTTVRLIPDLVDVDALEFERLATDAGLEALSNAAALYAGEFLEGISIRDAACQDWLETERNRFKRQYIEILTNLGHTLLASRDPARTIKIAERLVAEDTLGESGWRLLMRAYADNGDRSHALQAFKRCQQALRSELDVEPEVTTLELRDRIASSQMQPAPADETPPVVTESRAHSVADTGEAPPESDHSIAVLPFDNLSGDPEQEYFSDGITDSIIVNLALFPDLQVKSRNSSFAFKEQIKSIGEISEELNVDYLVEGSIRKSVDRIRITVQLIEVASGNQVWGKRYDAELENLFDLEEELSRTIAATVTGQIESDLQRIAIAKGAAGQHSYDLLLSGIYHGYRFNRSDNVIAIEKLDHCLVEDPDNVRAHAYLNVSHTMNYLARWTEDYQASFDLARTHIETALQLAPELALVQTFYAEYLSFCGKPAEAHRYLDRALEINPNDTDALAIRANCLALQGDFETSLQVAEQVCRMDPYHPWAEWELAGGQYNSGKYQEVLETIARYRTDPDFVYILEIACHVKLDHLDAARKALRDFLQGCRKDMLSMPQTLQDWLQYIHSTYPYDDFQYSQDLYDCLVKAGLSEPTGSSLQGTEETSHSIAVLPFDNLSGDPAQEYFSDGISESIILHLNLFPDLKVKSRNSSFAFKQQIKSIGEISTELDVDYLVEGSLRKSSDQIRITVQLVEAASGNQIWGKRYDAKIENLFELEEELSRSIAATVTGQIESDLQRIALAKGAADQQAYDFLLAGIYHLNRSNRDDIAIAIDKLEQCLQLDPNNIRAHAALYNCHIMNWMDRLVVDCQASFELAGKFAVKTLELDPELGEAQYTYGEYLMFCREYEKAGIHIDRALAINPNNPDYLTGKAMHLSMQGEFEAAIEVATQACLLDPYNWWSDWNLAEAQYLGRRYQDALDTIAKSRNAPGFIRIYSIAANVKLGHMEAARHSLKVYLQACRESMRAMPGSLDEWLQYTSDTAPFSHPEINRDIIDCLVQAGLTDESGSPQGKDEADRPSLLVLPFKNISDDPEQEYFSDGITESIILSLSAFNGLNIKSRHASFAFKDSSSSIDEISAELGVQYIVEGSIRKFGDQVRITVQLGDASNGNQLWGKRFDARLDELFSLEEEMVKSIAGTISGRIGKEIKNAAIGKPAKDLKSYDYLMRGLYHLEKFTASDNLIAREQLEKCLERDSNNAEACSLLGETYVMDLYENWTVDREGARRLMQVHADRAVELEPDSALAHAFTSEQLLMAREFERALFHAERAIELNPTLPDGYSMKCGLLGAVRRYDEALEYADLSMQIDPYHPYAGWNAGEVYRTTGQYERAVKAFRSVPHISPSLRAQTAASLAGMGDIDEARAEMQRYLELAREQMPNMPNSEPQWRKLWSESMPFMHEEDSKTLFELLLKAGLCDEDKQTDDELPSIAVLPFENMSVDPEQVFFSEGITADIISTLSKFRHLRIVARHSTDIYRDSKPPIAEIASQQQVRYILEGSVRRSGNRIRVSAELIDSENEQICWSERFDRDLDDLFAVQDEITREITLAMKVHLDDGEMALHRSAGTTNIKAWELTMMSIDLQDTYIRENILEARAMANQALALDPDYVFAWVSLAWTHWQEAYSGWSKSREECLAESEKASRCALDLDPQNADALSQAGTGYLMRHDTARALEYCQKAIELEPGNAENQALMAFTYIFVSDYQQARLHFQNVQKLCPIQPNWYYLIGAQIEQYDGDHERAIEIYRQGLAVEPDAPLCRFYLVHALMQKGDTPGAQQYADEIRALDSSVNGSGLVHTMSLNAEIRDEFYANLEKFNLV